MKTSNIIKFALVPVILLFFNNFSYSISVEHNENAAKTYRSAASMLIDIPDNFVKISNDIINKGTFKENREIENLLIRNKDSIIEYKKAAKLKNCDFLFGKRIENINPASMMPNFYNEVTLTKLVVLEGVMHETNDRAQLALENYISVLRFSNQLGKQKQFIMYAKTLEMMLQNLIYVRLYQCILDGKLNEKNYQYLLDNLLSVKEQKSGLEDAFKEEKQIIKNSIRTMSDREIKELNYNGESLQELFNEFDNLADKYFVYLIKSYSNNNPEIYEEKMRSFTEELKAEHKHKNNNSPSLVAKIIFSIAMPKYNRTINKYYSSLCELDILITVVAIKLFEIKNGRLPVSLNELTPSYLSELPKDHFNGFKPLKYEKRKEGWFLYGIGPDRKDDHAKSRYTQDDEDMAGDIYYLQKP